MPDARPTATIRLEGRFDLPAARLIAYSLKRMSAGDEVRLDFAQVREFHDFAVALLAQALHRSDGVVVTLEGLRMHQVRLLRYFGVGAEAFRPAAADAGDAVARGQPGTRPA